MKILTGYLRSNTFKISLYCVSMEEMRPPLVESLNLSKMLCLIVEIDELIENNAVFKK